MLKTRIGLVEDHQLFRATLKRTLEDNDTVEVVFEASTSREALDALTRANGECDLVLLDLSLPEQDGIWLIENLRVSFPQVTPVALTMHCDERLVLRALDAGAKGYITKNISEEEFLRAVHQVRAGRCYIDPRVADLVLEELRTRNRRRATAGAPTDLTVRQREVLALTAQGLKYREIAHRLCVSLSTVKSEIRTIFDKLGTRDRTQAVLRGIRRGFIPAPGLEAQE
ncbi:MAG: response regulator transcription factor [Armatimonadetes bacterium]|nr:response regulator transcription factor [Armatimonadota bacterium]